MDGSGVTGKPNARTKKTVRGQRRSHTGRLKTRVQNLTPKSGTSTKRPRGTQVRERILHAALECFGAFGFEGTSTRAVAARAGTSHPLLLYHFGSKDQLWQSMMEDVIGRYINELDARLAKIDPEDAGGRVRVFIENFIGFSARVPQLHRIMTQQSTQGSDRIQWILDKHLRDSFTKICKLIRRAQAAGTIRQGDPARLYYAIIGLGGTLLSVSTEFRILTGRDVFDETEMSKTIETICAFVFL